MKPIEASVVVVTRDRAASLERTLTALAKQSFRAHEVIVIDNGSVDDTEAVVKRFDARYESLPGRGIAECRQRGVDLARGSVVAMCDDDCVPAEDWLEELVRFFEANPDVALIGGLVNNIGFEGRSRFKGKGRIGPSGQVLFVENPDEAEYFGSANTAFRKDALAAVGGYDPFFASGYEEIDVCYRLRARGYRIAYLPTAKVDHIHVPIRRKQRFPWSPGAMRIYFFFKHQLQGSVGSLLRFIRLELFLFGRDIYRLLRALLRGEVKDLGAWSKSLLIAISDRLLIPFLYWRASNSVRNHRDLDSFGVSRPE